MSKNQNTPVKYYKSHIRACLDVIEFSRKNPGKPVVVVDFALLSRESFISGDML